MNVTSEISITKRYTTVLMWKKNYVYSSVTPILSIMMRDSSPPPIPSLAWIGKGKEKEHKCPKHADKTLHPPKTPPQKKKYEKILGQ